MRVVYSSIPERGAANELPYHHAMAVEITTVKLLNDVLCCRGGFNLGKTVMFDLSRLQVGYLDDFAIGYFCLWRG